MLCVYLEPFGLEVGFEFADIDHVEMKDGGGEQNGGARLGCLVEMPQPPSPPMPCSSPISLLVIA